jgi:hypothetical protein
MKKPIKESTELTHRQLKKRSKESACICADSEIIRMNGKYTEKQLTQYLLEFVKNCKVLNAEKPIYIYCVQE